VNAARRGLHQGGAQTNRLIGPRIRCPAVFLPIGPPRLPVLCRNLRRQGSGGYRWSNRWTAPTPRTQTLFASRQSFPNPRAPATRLKAATPRHWPCAARRKLRCPFRCVTPSRRDQSFVFAVAFARIMKPATSAKVNLSPSRLPPLPVALQIPVQARDLSRTNRLSGASRVASTIRTYPQPLTPPTRTRRDRDHTDPARSLLP